MRRRAARTLAACLALALAVPAGLPASAQESATTSVAAPLPAAEARALLEAVGMYELLPIMREEGMSYSDTLREQLFPGQGGAGWAEMVGEIYQLDRLERVVARRFAAEMGGVDIAPLMDFFTSPRGTHIVELEISARRALLDEAVEEVSRAAYEEMRAQEQPRLEVLRGFIEENDLVETNIAGALNSNLAFYQGLAAGGALPGDMSEQDMLRDVWMQEPEIREETEGWVWSYLAMAYKPLEDADIEAYTALSRTPEGRALNRALFASFDDLFTAISRDLGLGASRFMASEDI